MTTYQASQNEATATKAIKVTMLLVWGAMTVLMPAWVIYMDFVAGHILAAVLKSAFAAVIAFPFCYLGLPIIVRTLKN